VADIAGMSPLDDADPTELGPYRLLGRLGDGGMGSVYLGRREGGGENGPLVAVKVIRPDLARQPQFRERFLREAQAAHRVARFCTAEVLDVSTHGSRPYLVTEYIDGPTLEAAVEEHGPLQAADLERLAVAIASALTAIHAAGVIHRDLKPSNILLSSAGARVIDFGIARALDAGETLTDGSIGTPGYLAPEQAAGEAATEASDIYAWGAVMLFAATGSPPFGVGSTPVILHRVLTATPDLSGVPEHLRGLVARTMARDRAERPGTDALLLLTHRLHAARRPTGPDGPHVGPEPDVTRPARVVRASADPAPSAVPGRTARRWAAAGVALALVVTGVVVAEARGGGRPPAPGASSPASARATASPSGAGAATLAAALTRAAPTPVGGLLRNASSTMAFSPAGRTLAVAGTGGAVTLWNLADPARPVAFGTPFGTETAELAFSPDGHLLLAMAKDGTAVFWNVTDPTKPRDTGGGFGLTYGSTDGRPVTAVFSPDGHTLAVTSGNVEVLWSIADPASPRVISSAFAAGALGAAFSPDGRMLATDAIDGGVEFWDLSDQALPAALGPRLDAAAGGDLLFSPNGRVLVTVGEALRFWDVTHPTAPAPLGQPKFGAFLPEGDYTAAYSADGSVLVTADGSENAVRLWNVTDPANPVILGKPLTGQASGYANAVIAADGTVLATLAGDDTIQLWKLP
jgi:hypothetical protein